jgi:hypothetical protein
LSRSVRTVDICTHLPVHCAYWLDVEPMPTPPASLVPLAFSKAECYIYKGTHQPTQFDSQNGSIIYSRNVGNIAHNHAMYQGMPKR